MNKTNTLKSNSNFSGSSLALSKMENIELCQQRVWSLSKELHAFSALFRNLGGSDFSQDEFYGISLQLERMSKRLDKISSLLLKSITVDDKN